MATARLLPLALLPAAAGHALWSRPFPRHDADNQLKAHPCGTGDQYNDWTAPFTTLHPGRQPLLFRETIKHNGAPYRVALAVGSDDTYDVHVLLDQIPHNDEGFLIGNHMHEIEIDVPDVDCTEVHCALQLVQVMTDKFGRGVVAGSDHGHHVRGDHVCRPDELKDSCGNPSWVYFSCANVRIDGRTPARELAPIYRSYDGATSPQGWRGVSAHWYQWEDGVWRLTPPHHPHRLFNATNATAH